MNREVSNDYEAFMRYLDNTAQQNGVEVVSINLDFSTESPTVNAELAGSYPSIEKLFTELYTFEYYTISKLDIKSDIDKVTVALTCKFEGANSQVITDVTKQQQQQQGGQQAPVAPTAPTTSANDSQQAPIIPVVKPAPQTK
jgi:hypothetical protein